MEIKKIVNSWLVCLGLCMLASLIPTSMNFFLYDTAWHKVLCVRHLAKFGIYDWIWVKTIFECIWHLLAIPYEYATFYKVECRHLLGSMVFAPIFEEILFRLPLLYIKRLSTQRMFMLCSIISTILFVFGHPTCLLGLIPIGTFAVSSIYLTVKTQSIIPSILLHSAYNSLIFFWGFSN